MKQLLRLATIILLVTKCRADINDIERLFRLVLTEQHNSSALKPEDLAGAVTGDSALQDATGAEVARVLRLAKLCLDSSDPVVRRDGMLLMSTVATARLDNSTLLEPYFELLASFLTDSDAGQKQGAILALAYGYPRPGPRALTYLASHLNDEQNSGTQFLMITGALLIGAPPDAMSVRTVLMALERRHDRKALTGDMVQALGHPKVATEEALLFIRSSLKDNNAEVRRLAVEAVGRMPKDVRNGFATDLQRLLANADEAPGVLSMAREVILK